ncbi:VWA domain-containing protein [Duganella dendranthematis]|uniref:VWA domain-containing protein n=1 Tax=Duganella dendranthematis TaxID=2728021 RepID=A0ABX6M429_9BURK|nr:VWA domain-containing protein [Duganella dendranthematis]QJD88953.1 VWA domain-containing protein [Duganella dendranthematis]
MNTPLLEQWRAAWEPALAAWSRFTRLRDARLCQTTMEAAREGLQGSFAMIRLRDQSVVVDLQSVRELGLQDYAVEILAHEIGHHILAPATAADQFRLVARLRRALPTLEAHAPMVGNLYTDLYINDRLQRQAGLRMADIYRRLQAHHQLTNHSKVWLLYMRIYEELWKLPRGDLGGGAADDAIDTDAWLGARLIRVYARDWMDGAGRFATLLLPYLVEGQDQAQEFSRMFDTRDAAEGCEPAGGQQIEPGELEPAIHPVHDPRISGLENETQQEAGADQQGGQTREPFEYGEILKASGVKLSEEQIAIRYYRERALPHLISFPKMPAPSTDRLQLEGVEAWQIGDPLEQIDWLQSVIQSPRPIPGITTVQRRYGPDGVRPPKPMPIDLDMYVDSSGSMPDPRQRTSYLALAGAIIGLSALRAGSRVQVTLWSGKNQFMSTDGFTRNEDEVLGILTGFYGGATCFPIHKLRDTFKSKRACRTHILMISDDGITTMFDQDERGNDGWSIAATALKNGDAGGTMALNIPTDWAQGEPSWYQRAYKDLKRARSEQDWQIHAIAKFEDLVEFARAFSRRHYAPNSAPQKEHP